MTQSRYSLSDSDMLSIFERIDRSTDPNGVILNTVIGMWNAILGQEGESWESYTAQRQIDPTAFAIPQDQAIEISERMKKRLFALHVSDIGVTNALLDLMNVGPSTYNDSPKQSGTDHILPPKAEVSDRTAAIMDTFDDSWAD